MKYLCSIAVTVEDTSRLYSRLWAPVFCLIILTRHLMLFMLGNYIPNARGTGCIYPRCLMDTLEELIARPLRALSLLLDPSHRLSDAR